MFQGGCYCGSIRYEITGQPEHLTNCHCTICRRISAAPFVSWFSVPVDKFRFIKGVATQFKSTPEALRSFCPTCGTQLTFTHTDDPQYIDITTCSLDDPDLCQPQDHTFLGDKLEWVELGDHLPRYVTSRSEGQSR